MDLILASGSPRRKKLLAELDIPFSVHPADVDETLDPKWTAGVAVENLSARKAAAVAELYPDQTVLAADTVVCLGHDILGKPADAEEASAMLHALADRTHRVITGVTIRRGEKVVTFSQETYVTFRKISDLEIEAYIHSGEPMDKAGAYAIQGLGALFVSKIKGDFYNVVGLPVDHVKQILAEEFGYSFI